MPARAFEALREQARTPLFTRNLNLYAKALPFLLRSNGAGKLPALQLKTILSFYLTFKEDLIDMKLNFENAQKYLSFLMLISCLLISTTNAQAQKARFALIIGNSDYDSMSLRNPVNDARLISDSLKSVGFQTTVKENLTLAEMKTAIRNFVAQMPSGGVGLFYYAGHGIQLGGRNFLIPTDFDAAESDVAKQSLEVDELLKTITGKSGLNIIILDACRNAPEGFTASNKQGLAEIRNAPIGTFIAFSTAPGKTAKDGTGKNSPYSEALARNLRLRPSRLEDVFIRTRIQVDSATGGQQTPWENSSIRSPFYFTEDTFADSSPANISPVISNILGKLPSLSVVVPILNESGRQISTVNKTILYFAEERIGLEMAQIRGGNFLMGTNWTEIEKAYNDSIGKDELTQATIAAEMPQHQVNIDGFFMSRYEITQAQWQAVMGNLPNGIPPNFRGTDFPVVNVNWHQANDFCQKLSLLTGKTYRLPTEAEWEYAAKAGSDAPFGFGKSINSNLANFMATVPSFSAVKGEYRQSLVAVGSFKAFNGFGLADMHGNVWEWTADNWSDDYDNSPTDGSAWETDDEDYRLYRVMRGGSWDSIGNNCRATLRRKQPQTVGSTKIGFRVVMQ